MLKLLRVLGSSVVSVAFVLSVTLRVLRSSVMRGVGIAILLVLLGVEGVLVVGGLVFAICFVLLFSIVVVNSLLANGKMGVVSSERAVVWDFVLLLAD